MSIKNKKENIKKLANAMPVIDLIALPSASDVAKGEKSLDTYSWPKVNGRVPDIFLHKPVDFAQHVCKILCLGIKFFRPLITQYHTKIRCLTYNDHKDITQYFKKNHLPYHTYGLPSKQKLRVVIRGLPNDIDLGKVKSALKSASIPIIRVHKMHRKEDVKDTNCLILAVVPHNVKGNNLLQIINILGHDVKMEPPKTKTKQCYRCQKWGHSQRYCHGEIKCVKCAGEHLTKKCERNSEKEPPKCANCGDNHTANYKQCKYCPDSDAYKKNKSTKVRPKRKPKLVTMQTVNKLYKNYSYRYNTILIYG